MHKPLSSHHTPWQSAVATARRVYHEGRDFVFCYSSLDTGFSGKRSLLAYNPQRSVTGDSFTQFEHVLTQDKHVFENAWFGYLGYGLRHDVEHLPKGSAAPIDMPNLWMTQFASLIEFDHVNKQCCYWGEGESNPLPMPMDAAPAGAPTVNSVASNMDKASYLKNVEQILHHIRQGEIYQANLTRKFFGEFTPPVDAFECFVRLCEASPAPYSCFMKLGDTFILSSSPECFLTIGSDGAVEARPIKGTAPRFSDPERDKASREKLEESSKDKAENLMIVDLMRNDLARGGCISGSVAVSDLFEVRSYATLHHMASTIRGIKRPDVHSLELVKQCFPPGSMTGAPKIRAMEICTELEKLERGIYAGAIGWLGGDGSVDLSVVIRTIIIQGNQFEFQAGGAIVADSVPEQEWQEALVKTRGICKALGLVPEEDLIF